MSESSSSAAPASSRLLCIDFLRGSASLAVVLYHVALCLNFRELYPALFPVFQEGRLGVPLFFVISGFCIHLRWAKQNASGDTPRIDFRDFWKRRFLRLYPAYLVMLCITTALVVAAVYYEPLAPYIHREEKNAALTGWWLAADFLAHVFMLHGLHPWFDMGGGNEVYWTLAREEYLYLLYLPLLMWRRTWGMARAIGLVILISLTVPIGAYAVTKLLHLPQDTVYPVNMSNSAIALWAQWALGMVAVEAYFGTIKLPKWCSDWRIGLLWFLAALVAYNLRQGWQIAALLRGLAFFTLVNYCVNLEKQGKWLSNFVANQLTNIGIFSYSLYLVHYPLLRILSGLESQFRLQRGMGTPGPVYYVVLYLAFVVISVFAGKLLFVLVEQRCLPSAGRVPVAGGLYGPAETATRASLLQRLNPFGWLRP